MAWPHDNMKPEEGRQATPKGRESLIPGQERSGEKNPFNAIMYGNSSIPESNLSELMLLGNFQLATAVGKTVNSSSLNCPLLK